MKQLFYIISLIVLLFGTNETMAQNKIEFTASSPSKVFLNTPFQLAYTINASAKDLRAPDFQFFEILAGPFESKSSSWQSINGKTSTSVSLTYTFTLLPNKTGTFKIPPASIVVDGEKVFSNEFIIKVEDEQNSPVSSSSQGTQNRGSESNVSASNTQKVTNESIFIRTIVSKSNLYEQESFLVTYKLYTLLDIAQFTDIKLPDYSGFLKQEIEQPTNKQLSAETYNGRNYGTVVLYQALLFPQRTGDIVIQKADFTALLRLRNQSQMKSIFDDFFDTYSNVEKKLIAPGARIHVNPLPISGKPSSFSGAVGDFKMSTSISTENTKTNEPVTIKIVISGSGNMKLLKNPELKFPDSFETYDPKIENNFNVGTNGISGTKTIEYLFIPRHSGSFDIPSAELSYFDLSDKTYKTLSTPKYSINVVKGEGKEAVITNFANKEEVTEIAKDIRYIHTDKITLQNEKRPLFGSLLFWMLYIIPTIFAIILTIFIQRKIKENEDIVFVKTKRANKVAQKRLKLANKFLREGENAKFHEELMKATWSYLSDKLSIPVANLNKDNISSNMKKREINDELIDKFISILNKCEFASYAPNGGQTQMNELYDETVDVISQIEQYSKKQKK